MTKLPKPLNTPVVVKVVRVSGTIKKAEEEVIRRAKEIILRARLADSQDAGVVQDIMKAVEKKREVEALVDDEEEEDDDDSE